MPTADVRAAIPAVLDAENLTDVLTVAGLTAGEQDDVRAQLRGESAWKRRSKKVRGYHHDRLFRAQVKAGNRSLDVYAGVISTDSDDEVRLVRFGLDPVESWWPSTPNTNPYDSRLSKVADHFDPDLYDGDDDADYQDKNSPTYRGMTKVLKFGDDPSLDQELADHLDKMIDALHPHKPLFWGDIAEYLDGSYLDEDGDTFVKFAARTIGDKHEWLADLVGDLHGFRVSTWLLAGSETLVLFAVDANTGAEHIFTVHPL